MACGSWWPSFARIRSPQCLRLMIIVGGALARSSRHRGTRDPARVFFHGRDRPPEPAPWMPGPIGLRRGKGFHARIKSGMSDFIV